MNLPNVIISLSYTVPVQDAPALLQQLLASLPSGVTMTSPGTNLVARAWPAVPNAAGEEFRARAERNLRQLQEDSVLEQGWGNVKDLAGAIRSLPANTLKVVMRAIENGGHITREEVFAVIGRETGRTLKGFTKPVARLMERLKSHGELGEDAAELLEPIYKESQTYQQAQGFAVPVQVVSLMTRRLAQTN